MSSRELHGASWSELKQVCATGSLPVALANLTPSGLTQASGEPATGTQQTTIDAMSQFMSLLTDVFSSGRSGIAN